MYVKPIEDYDPELIEEVKFTFGNQLQPVSVIRKNFSKSLDFSTV